MATLGWRYIATRLNGDGTEEILATELELSGVEITPTLSGNSTLTATITPEVARLQDANGRPIFTTWSTAIYAEKDGVIRAGGILTDMAMEDANLSITCGGFVSYIDGQPYIGAERQWIGVDPLAVARFIWTQQQAMHGANIGLKVSSNTSPVRIGTDPKTVSLTTGAGEDVEFEAGPYKINTYSTNDLGQEFNNLAEATPFDYVEKHAWSGETITHTLQLGYPSIGRRRTDLRFAVGENIIIVPTVEQDIDSYASDVLILGAGEGNKMVYNTVSNPTDRLRRFAVVTDKTVRSKSRAATVGEAELKLRTGGDDVSQLVVMDHPNAPLGSFGLGDEILVQGAQVEPLPDTPEKVLATNLVFNPSGASGTTSPWVQYGTNVTVSAVIEDSEPAIKAMKTAISTSVGITSALATTIPAGTQITLSAQVKKPAGSTSLPVSFFIRDDANNDSLAYSSIDAGAQRWTDIPTDEWVDIYVTCTVKPDRNISRIYITNTGGNLPVGETLFVRNVILNVGPKIDFFDGDAPSEDDIHYRWTGARNESTSEMYIPTVYANSNRNVGWAGGVYLWVRILSYSLSPEDGDQITLDVQSVDRSSNNG